MTKKIIALDKKHLKDIIQDEINNNGLSCDLNHIDVSNVKDLVNVFFDSKFNGDISNWNTSNVTDMGGLFYCSEFNGDISKWDTSNVTNMKSMFELSMFNGDISNWNTSNVTNMYKMFRYSRFNGDISNWNVANVEDMRLMFHKNDKNKPWWFIENNNLRKKAIDSYNLHNELDGDLTKKPNSKIKVKI